MSRYWIGVASRDHVLKGVEGGFCQYCHGMAWPIRKLSNGDGIVYYSPRTERRGGDPVQGFTAIGEVTDNTPRQVEMAPGFVPMRCTVEFVSCQETPIRQLLDHLDFSRGNPNWGSGRSFQSRPEKSQRSRAA
jgi:hypothetical protein